MRNKSIKPRELYPDIEYNSILVTKFINCIMMNGKKSLAASIIYKTLNNIKKITKEYELEILNKSINNVKPILEVKSKKIGGMKYQIPKEITDTRSLSLAIKWIIDAAKKRKCKTMIEKLTLEILDALNNKGEAIKKKKNIYTIAESNKAFSHIK